MVTRKDLVYDSISGKLWNKVSTTVMLLSGDPK